jgi:uncharacterized protein
MRVSLWSSRRVAGVVLGLAGAFGGFGALAQARFVTIGTGGVSGVYYAAGGAICHVVNLHRAQHGLRCAAESSAGSVANVANLRKGEQDFAFVQSDVQADAMRGAKEFAAVGAFGDLRAVFSVHAEPFTLLARREAGIATVADLKGKRVNLGNPGSGTRAQADELLAALGWKPADMQAAALKPDEAGPALCDGKLDALAFAVGHPNASLHEAIVGCGARLVPVAGPAVDKLVAERPALARTTIAAGLYPQHPQPTASFGTLATLVSSTRMPADAVYGFVKAVFENFEVFKSLHPALAGLTPDAMVRGGLTAPLHEGAARYYRERGWLK